MSGILCPIRGGPRSQSAIELGIQLAKQTDEGLHFLFVVNLDFLNQTEVSRTHVISQEMHAMGEFILLTARLKAEEEGIVAECSVRQGDVMEEIIELAKEIEAEHVILGRPQREEKENLFTSDHLQSFVSRLEEEIGTTVVLAEHGGEE